MSDKKELKFSIVVDERAALQAKRVIRELISDSEKLVKTLASVSIGGAGGGGLISGGSVGGAQTQGQMTAAAMAPRQAGPITNQQKSLAQIFLDSSKGIKDLASISKDSMRIMSDGIKRGIDEQKRSIAELDADLAGLAERYKQVSQARKISEASGSVSGEVVEGLKINEHALLQRQQELLSKRESQRKDLGSLDERRRQIAIAMGGGGGGDDDDDAPPGMFGRFRGRMGAALSKGARWGVVGGAALAGVVAGASELQAQPFDFVTQQARQAQAMGTMGVATRGGDLRYAAAMMQVFRDKDKMKEFLQLGDQNISSGISTGVGGAISGLFQGNPNVVGSGIRAIEGIQSHQKERLRQYMEQQIQTDPRFFANLDRFQSEADARVSVMRRTGYGEHNLYGALKSAGEDMGTFGSAFESVRAGGRGFAQRALWTALRANRSGMDMGAAGGLLAAGAPGGASTQLYNAVTTGTDVVAAEHLARAIAQALQQTIAGPASGLGLAGAMGSFGKSPMDVYRSAQMGQGLAGMGGMLGGADPLGVGINVLAANRMVGPGGDLYKVNFLTEMMKDPATMMDAMMGKDDNPYLKAMLGENYKGDIQTMFRESMTRNIRARYIDQGGANLTPATKTMQKLVRDYGGDIGKFFESEQAAGRDPNQLLTELGGGLHNILPQTFPTVQAGEAGARLFAYAGGVPNIFGKGGGDASFGSAAGDYKKGRIKTTEEEMQSFIDTNKTFVSQLSQDMKVIGNIFDRMGGIDLSADHAAKSLMALADAADGLTRKYGGTPPERAKEDLDAIRRNKQSQMDNGGGAKMMSKSQAEKLFKGFKMTGQASPEAQAAFKAYGLK